MKNNTKYKDLYLTTRQCSRVRKELRTNKWSESLSSMQFKNWNYKVNNMFLIADVPFTNGSINKEQIKLELKFPC